MSADVTDLKHNCKQSNCGKIIATLNIMSCIDLWLLDEYIIIFLGFVVLMPTLQYLLFGIIADKSQTSALYY